MPLLKVVVSSTRNSTETVAALERDLDEQSPSTSTHEDQELPDHKLGEENSQVISFTRNVSVINLANIYAKCAAFLPFTGRKS